MNESVAAFGTISALGKNDVVMTFDNSDTLTFTLKGNKEIAAVQREKLLRAVQNVLSTTQLSLYFNDEHLPLHLSTLSEMGCGHLCHMLNDYIHNEPLTYEDDYFTKLLEGFAEKKGKHHWTKRFLRIYGKRLFIFRESFEELNGQFPLNVIDIPSMLIEHEKDNIIKIVTHREYEFRFENNATADQWYQQLCKIIRKGNEQVEEPKSESDFKLDLKHGTISTIDDDIHERIEQKVVETKMKHGKHPSLVSAQYLQEKLKEREQRLKASEEHNTCTPPPIPPPPPRRDHIHKTNRIILCNYE